jgi:hypothetical protein
MPSDSEVRRPRSRPPRIIEDNEEEVAEAVPKKKKTSIVRPSLSPPEDVPRTKSQKRKDKKG